MSWPLNPKERRDNVVWDAIYNNQLKQAEQLCRKRLKKGENTDDVQVRSLYLKLIVR